MPRIYLKLNAALSSVSATVTLLRNTKLMIRTY